MVMYCKLPVFIYDDYTVFLFQDFFHYFHLLVKPIKYTCCPSVTLFTHSTASNEQHYCHSGLPAPVLDYRTSPALLISNIDIEAFCILQRELARADCVHN